VNTATVQLTTRRLIFAGGFAFAIAVAPALAAFAGPTAYPALRAIAQGTECGEGLSMNPDTHECVPDVAPGGGVTSSGNFFAPAPAVGGGAPSEGELTEINAGR
jgi:hypothetical protein